MTNVRIDSLDKCQKTHIFILRISYFYRMKKHLLFILLILLLMSCKSTTVGSTNDLKIHFLDDYIVEADRTLDGTKIGGLSGIDFHNGDYFIVSDDPSTPRFYKAEIELDDDSIHKINFTEVIRLDTEDDTLKEQHLDLESIVYNPADSSLVVTSEGSVNNAKDPGVFKISPKGEFLEAFKIPDYFNADSPKEPRNNGLFEGLAASYDGKGYWVATELPLKTDGPKPKLYSTKSPVRITYYDKETKQATRQFPYRLGRIRKIPWLYFAVNGVTDLLEYAPDKFLIIERGFAAGNGQSSNTIRLYDVDASLGTNTLNRNNLRVSFYNPAQKELLYDFKWAEKYLDQGIIDNIEGITFGPVLPNGNQSIILISDNNFNSIGKQLNQFILMEIKVID